jgi:hypothetical protein
MNQPPPEITWLGAIGGGIAFIRLLIDLINMWRNRSRHLFRVITATRNFEIWTDFSIGKPTMPVPNSPPIMKEGDWRKAFITLEFTIKNNYPIDISVGRFKIEDWIFENQHERWMYAPKRDYRVFNLFSHERVSLSDFHRLSPKEIMGFRVEILEETSGPSWESSKSRYILHLPKVYRVEFYRDDVMCKSKIRIRNEIKIRDIRFVHHWSDLLEKFPSAGDGAPLPQGLTHQK